MTFEEVVMESYKNDELIEQYNRLTGSTLKRKKSSIYQLIDEATGKEEAELKGFISFVDEYVFHPLVVNDIQSNFGQTK